MKKLLLIGDLNTVFTFEFLTEILSHVRNFQVSVLTSGPLDKLRADAAEYCTARGIPVDTARSIEGDKKRRLPHPVVLLRSSLRLKACRKQDIILVHGVPANAAAIALFAPRRARVVVSYYGSDLLRATKAKLLSHRLLLRRANQVTVATQFMRSTLSHKFSGRFDNKTSIVQYGAKVIDSLCRLKQGGGRREDFKRAFGFPEDKVLVYIGYNGSRAQRHMEITRQLAKLEDGLKERLYLVNFCSYGLPKGYREEIEQALYQSGIAGKVATDYLRGEQMARFRLAADIMLNLQLFDAFSASMQEHLEAGTIVIKGDWLQYPELDALKATVESIPSLEALPDKVRAILKDLTHYRKQAQHNDGLVYAFLSWGLMRERWLGLVLGNDSIERMYQ